MQQPVRERPPPVVADDLGTENDIAERTRYAFRNLVAAVDREREDVGRLVDPEVVTLQAAHLVGADERDAELPRVDAFGAEDAAGELDRRSVVDLHPASILDVDRDHLLRSSVCSL